MLGVAYETEHELGIRFPTSNCLCCRQHHCSSAILGFVDQFLCQSFHAKVLVKALHDVTLSEPQNDLAKPNDGKLELVESEAPSTHFEKMRVHSRNQTRLSREENPSLMVLYQLGAVYPLHEDLRPHILLVATVYD